jgi:hypothetical protein
MIVSDNRFKGFRKLRGEFSLIERDAKEITSATPSLSSSVRRGYMIARHPYTHVVRAVGTKFYPDRACTSGRLEGVLCP